jgi:hypothetical protein
MDQATLFAAGTQLMSEKSAAGDFFPMNQGFLPAVTAF